MYRDIWYLFMYPSPHQDYKNSLPCKKTGLECLHLCPL